MNVEQLVWWWQTGWATWAREHGVDVEEKESLRGDSPDKAAFRARYGGGKTVGR